MYVYVLEQCLILKLAISIHADRFISLSRLVQTTVIQCDVKTGLSELVCVRKYLKEGGYNLRSVL